MFQYVVDCTCQLIACYLDDILISATTVEENDVLVEKVLQRVQYAGIHLHEEKCQFGQR